MARILDDLWLFALPRSGGCGPDRLLLRAPGLMLDQAPTKACHRSFPPWPHRHPEASLIGRMGSASGVHQHGSVLRPRFRPRRRIGQHGRTEPRRRLGRPRLTEDVRLRGAYLAYEYTHPLRRVTCSWHIPLMNLPCLAPASHMCRLSGCTTHNLHRGNVIVSMDIFYLLLRWYRFSGRPGSCGVFQISRFLAGADA